MRKEKKKYVKIFDNKDYKFLDKNLYVVFTLYNDHKILLIIKDLETYKNNKGVVTSYIANGNLVDPFTGEIIQDNRMSVISHDVKRFEIYGFCEE